MHRINFADLMNGTTGFSLMIIILSLIFIIAQLIIFSVLIFKYSKFKRETVKENFSGMRGLAVTAKIFVFLDIASIILSLFDIPELINDWDTEEFDAASLIGWIFPVMLLIYGIYAWRCYIRAKKIRLHLFSGVTSKKRKREFTEDETDLFGDTKMIDLNAEKKNEGNSMESVDESYIQRKKADMNKPKPLADSELVPCPYCETLNAYKSKTCAFCGAELPCTEDAEAAPISSNDVGIK